MFHELPNATDDALSAVGFVAPLTGTHAIKFTVPEDEMLVEIGFEGVIVGDALAALAELGFQIDDALTLPATKLWASTVANLAATPVSLKRTYRLARGEHKAALFGQADAGAPILNGTVYPSRLSIKLLSNDNVLAANSNSKRQGIY